jgi:hypothetical protein
MSGNIALSQGSLVPRSSLRRPSSRRNDGCHHGRQHSIYLLDLLEVAPRGIVARERPGRLREMITEPRNANRPCLGIYPPFISHKASGRDRREQPTSGHAASDSARARERRRRIYREWRRARREAAEGAMKNYELLDGVLCSLIWTFLTGVRILFRFGTCPILYLWENRKLYISCATPGLSHSARTAPKI